MLTHQNDEAGTRPRRGGGGITDVKISHILHALGRYRPVFAVIGVVLALSIALPGPKLLGATPFAANQPSTPVGSGGELASPVPVENELAPTDVFSPPAPLGGASTYEFDSPTELSSPAEASPSATSESSLGAPASTSSGGTTRTTVRQERELKVAAAAWATRTAGTPVASTGVPEKSLPVGKRVGQDDKLSFIRIEGDTEVLVLNIVAGDGNRSADTARIRACQITQSGWKEAEALAFDAAPKYDSNLCVTGERKADGSWTFDLSRYPDRADARGFALVPHPEAPLDFQVAFARS